LLFGAAGLVEYQYDLGGNRTLWKQLVGQPQTYAPTSNRQTQYGSTSLTQDGAGNLTGYGTKTFSYDSANRMSQSVVGATTTAYRYNGLGQRTTRLATTAGNTVVTYYGYDPGGKYLGQTQVNPDGTYAQGDEYIWLDDMPIAQVHTVYGANNTVASQQLTYIHADHLNTPRAMTDASRKIVWKWESEAYGRTAPSTDPDGDGVLNRLDLRFPGQIYDAETGLSYNMNRYYDPITGRYTQSDPIGLAGGFNTYIYVAGNPLKFADPLGLIGGYGVAGQYLGGAMGGAGDFIQGYGDMMDATYGVGGEHRGWAGQDAYFHCRANCEASQRGGGGIDVANCISDTREWVDQATGDSPEASARDQIANQFGRSQGGANSAGNCQVLCGKYRPGGSFPF
jgi:RHS repeat-associated protein